MKGLSFPLRALFALSIFLMVQPLPADIVCQGESPDGEFSLTVTITYPDPGTVIIGRQPCPGNLRLRGSAVDAGSSLFDVFFVIDSSGSTFAASGLDIDGDTIVGEGDFLNNNDPGDSVLAAELLAVRRFVEQVDPDRVRISIIEFSAVIPIPPGLPEEQGRIRIVQPLTSDFGRVHAALDEIQQMGSVGATDYGGAVYKLIEEWNANADPDNREAIAFFISDGKPTFPRYPYDTTEIPDIDWAMEATADAAATGIAINTYEVGHFDDLSTLQAMADQTGGEFFPNLTPEDLIFFLESATLVQIESLVIQNLTTGQSRDTDPAADGDFSVRLDLVDGVNQFRVIATTSGGQVIEVTCETDVTIICLPPTIPNDRSDSRDVPGTPGIDRENWGGSGGEEPTLEDIQGALELIEAKLDQLVMPPPPPPDAPPAPGSGISCVPRDAAYWAGLCAETPGPYPAEVVRGFTEWSRRVDEMLLPAYDLTACAALRLESTDDPCAGAMAQYAGLLLNRASAMQGESCPLAFHAPGACFPALPDMVYLLDLPEGLELGPVSDVGELVQALDVLLAEGTAGGNPGACRLAELLARGANR
jgi:hypothetical protein